MLHLIFQSTVDSALLQRIDSGDDVVFLENAVFRVIKQGLSSVELQSLVKDRIYLHVLDVELETRGIDKKELIAGIEVIDYTGLVRLTEKNKVVRTWN